MKRKKFYAKPAKLLVLIIMLVAAAVMGLSGGVCAYTYGSFGVLNPATVKNYYLSSTLPNNLYASAVSFIDDTMENEQFFTSEGKVRRNGIFDLRDYGFEKDYEVGGDSVSDRKFLEYKIGDLLDFYRSDGYTVLKWLITEGNYQKLVTGGEADSADETSHFGTIYGKQAVPDGKKTVTFSHRDGSGKYKVTFKSYPDYAYSVLYNNGIAIEKEYHLRSVAGVTLANYAAKYTDKANTDVSLLDCYKTLCEAAENVYKTVKAGPTETADSNAMVYLYNTDTGKVYTNVKRWKTMNFREAKSDYLKKNSQQAVSWYDPATGTPRNTKCSADMSSEAESLKDQLVMTYHNGDYYVILGLDTSMPVQDNEMIKDMAAYDWMGSLPFPMHYAWPIFLISIAVLLLMAVGSGLQSGRTETDQEIHFRKIDRLPLELTILMDLFLWIIFLAFGMYATHFINFASETGYSKKGFQGLFQSEMSFVCLLGLCFCLIGGLLLTWTVRHYARRAKGKNPGGSLIAKGLKNLGVRSKTFYENRKENGKLIIRYVLFIVINVILGGLAIRGIGYDYGYSYITRPLRTLICGILWLAFVIYTLYRLLMMTKGREEIKRSIKEISNGNLDEPINLDGMSPYNKEIAEGLSHVKEGLKAAVEAEMKHERLKTDLITNVSHDIKTPLTSIINYVDILKRKDIQDPEIREYIDVLDRKSARLKQLVEDLVESSKISSGNITLDMQKIDLGQLVLQENGEYEEKFEARNLQLICTVPEEPMHIYADGRRMYRVIDNLYNNAAKYSMPGTRIYADVRMENGQVIFTVKNISENPLNISADELMERFVRGDVSRSTEGSGLGLEIARNLTTMQKGTFAISLDGDLFKVTITFAAM